MPVTVTRATSRFINDQDSDQRIDQGDVLFVRIDIQNDATARSGTMVTDTLNDFSLVSGTLNISPFASDDAYNAIGNTKLFVGQASPGGPAVTFNGNLVQNDFSAVSDDHAEVELISSSVGTFATSAGGSVTISADGTFVYTPKLGYVGDDTFSYTVTDHGQDGSLATTTDNLTDSAMVTIKVEHAVWYVADLGLMGGDGSAANPFQSIAAFNDASGDGAGKPAANDYVYINSGTYTETDGINLLNGQKLIGEGEGLTLAHSVGGSIVVEASAGVAGTPVIVVTGNGNAGVDLAQNNTIRGLDIGMDHAGSVGLRDNGSVGTLTISNVGIGVGAGFSDGQAIDIDQGGILNVQLEVLNSTGSTGQGVQLSGDASTAISGSFTVTSGSIQTSASHGFQIGNGFGLGGTVAVDYDGSIASASGSAVHVAGRTSGAGTISFDGNITHASAATGILVLGATSGTINFTGQSISLNSSAGGNAAVSLSGNSGATINFTPTAGGTGLDITSAAGAGFSATGGGTVTVTQTDTEGSAGNTISSGAGSALVVDNVFIGSAGLTFQSIDTTTASSNNAIKLVNTGMTAGTHGGLTVTGDGQADLGFYGANSGTGGIISNKSVDSIVLTDTRAVTLNGMTVNNNTGGSWIDADNVNGLTLNNFNANNSRDHGIDGVGIRNLAINGGIYQGGGILNPSANFDGIHLLNLLGSSSIIDATFERSNTRQIYIVNNQATNFGGAPDQLIVLGNTFQNHNVSLFHGDHLSVSADTGGNFRLILDESGDGTGNVFRTAGIAVQATGTGSGRMDAQISHITSGGTLASGFTNTAGVVVAGTASSTVTFLVEDNVILGSGSVGMSFNDFTSGSFSGTVQNNTITHVAGPGTDALQIISHGSGNGVGTADGTATIAVLNNFIEGNFQRGIRAHAAFDQVVLNLNISGNIVHGTDPTLPAMGGLALRAIEVEVGGSGGGTTDDIFLNLQNNNAWMDNGNAGYRLFHRAGYTFSLEDLTGSGIDAANITNWIDNVKANNSNGGAATTLISGVTNNFSTHATTAAPLLVTAPDADTAPETAIETSTPAETTPTPAAPDSETIVSPIVDDGVLSEAEIEFLFDAAIQRWVEAGATPDQVAAMRAASVSASDLDGLQVGQSQAGRIILDDNAAGFAWYLDTTPLSDDEYVVGANGILVGAAGTTVGNRIDLLTTIMHELGHQIGLDDSYGAGEAASLMFGYVSVGERRLPSQEEAAGASGQAVGETAYALSPVTLGTIPAGEDVTVTFHASYTGPGTNQVIQPLTNTSTVSWVGGSQTDDETIAVNSGAITIDSLTLGGTIWRDDGAGGGVVKDGIKQAGEAGIAGVAVSLYVDADGDGIAEGGAIDTAITDASGVYIFDLLAPGNYFVGVDQDNFDVGGNISLVATPVSSTPPSIDPDLGNVDHDDNGIAGTGVGTPFQSGTITLAYNSEPITDGDTDADTNFTLDLGFILPNAPPSQSNLSGDTATFTENLGSVFLDALQNGTILDGDSLNFDTGTLTVAIGTGLSAAEDQLVLNTTPNVTFTVDTVSVGGTQIATYTGGGAGGGALVFTFDADATPAAVTELVRAIGYANSAGDTPTNGDRTINWTLVDGDGTDNGAGNDTLSFSTTLNVDPVNDLPVVGGATIPVDFIEGVNVAADPVILNNSITLSDVDDTTFTSVTVAITNNLQSGEDELAFTNDDAVAYGDISGAYVAGTGILTLTSAGGSATLAQFQAAARAVTYDNSSEEPDEQVRTVQVRANDGDGLSNILSFDLRVTARNDSPDGTTQTLTILEDQVRTLTAGDFGFTDVDFDTLANVFFFTPPTGGTLFFDDPNDGGGPFAFSFPRGIQVAHLNEGRLTFVPTLDANGTAQAAIQFEVADSGGAVAGGLPRDQSADTLTFDITSVNDEPQGLDNSAVVDEDGSYVFKYIAGDVNDFGFSDVSDGNVFAGIEVITLPTAGKLFLDGVEVTLPAFVTAQDIADGKLSYEPAANGFGSGYATFTFAVRDNGATGGTNVNQDASPNTFSFDVTSINDAPTHVAPAEQSFNEDGSITFTGANAITVADDDAGGADLTTTVTVTDGALTVGAVDMNMTVTGAGGTTLTLTGTLAEINDALDGLTYTPPANANGSRTLTITTNDGGATGNDPGTSGTETSEEGSAQIVLTINSVNDAPTGASKTVETSEDDAYTFDWADFGFSDAIDNDAPLGIVITSLPGDGVLRYNGSIIVADGLPFAVSKDDIDLDRLTFTPTADEFGDNYATFDFKVQDDGETELGSNTSASSYTITIDVTPDNLPPTLTVTGAGSTYTEVAGANSAAGTAVPVLSDSTITDPDGTMIQGATAAITNFVAGDVLAIAAGFTMPAGITASYNSNTGVLTLSGSAATLADYETILKNVVFTNAGDNPTLFGANVSRTISFTITDALGGTDTENTTVAVAGTNDTPINVVGGAVTFVEDSSANPITGLSVSDADSDPASATLTVTLGVGSGALTVLTDAPGGVGAGGVAGNGTGTVVLTGSQNAINATLAATNGVVFTAPTNFNGSTLLTVTTADSAGAQDVDTKTINIIPVNDAPVIIGVGGVSAPTILEDMPSATGSQILSLLGGRYSDAADSQSANGGSSPGNFSGIAIVANGSGPLTGGHWQYLNASNVWTDIGAASPGAAVTLANTTFIRFNPTANFNGPAPGLTVRLMDNLPPAIEVGGTVDLTGGVGGITRYSATTITISQDVTPVNDAPTLVNLDGDQVTLTEGTFGVLFDQAPLAILNDVDSADFAGGSLTIVIADRLPEDIFGLSQTGNGPGQISLSGSSFLYGGVVFATAIDAVGGPGIVISFDSDASLDAVETLINRLAYVNLGGNYPTGGTRTFTWTLVDGDGTANQGSDTVTLTTMVNVVPVNDTPVLSQAPTVEATEQTLVAVMEGVTVSDADLDARNGGLGDYGGSSFSVSRSVATSTDDLFTIGEGPNFTIGDNVLLAGGLAFATFTIDPAGFITVDFTSSETIATSALVDEVIQAIYYAHGSDTPPSSVQLAYGFVDGSPGAGQGSGGIDNDVNFVTVNISAVNDAPYNDVPGEQTMDEDTSLVFGACACNGIFIYDADAASFAPPPPPAVRKAAGGPADGISPEGGTLTVTLSIEDGRLKLSGTEGLTVTGDDTNLVTLTGCEDAINAALEGLSYTPPANANGTRTLTITTNDNGNVGSGGPQTDEDDILITINAVNDPVYGSASAELSLDEDLSVSVTGLSIADVDAALAPAGIYGVTLVATNGTLSLGSTTGLVFSTGDGSADASMTFSGTLANINAALALASYSGAANYNGSATIMMNVTDVVGETVATGSGASTNDSDVINVTVNAVNDPVTTAAPSSLVVAEDGTAAITGLSIADVDVTLASEGVYEITLSATNGTISLTTLAKLTFSVGDGTADAAMTFTGTLADINAALATASYAGNPDYNGPATITFEAKDGIGEMVATGSGEPSSDSETINVTVTPVNDPVTTSAPATLTLNEDTGVAVTGLSIADDDAALSPGGLYQVTLTSTQGALSVTVGEGISFTAGDGSLDATMTFSGTFAAVNAALATMTYAGNANYNGPASITLSATDAFGEAVATGSGGATSDSDTINVTVNAVNDVPTGASNSVDGSEDDAIVFTAADFPISDPVEGHGFGGIRIVTLPADGQLRLNGVPVEVGQSISAAQIAEGAFTFLGELDGFGEPYTSFTFQTRDNGGTANGGVDLDPIVRTMTINLEVDNLPPEVDLDGGVEGINASVTYVEDGSIAIGTNISVVDPIEPGDKIETLTVTLIDPIAGDSLSVLGNLPAGISSTVATVEGRIVLTMSGAADPAAYQTALGQVRYSSSNQDPTAISATRTIEVVANDGQFDSQTATSTINVIGVNDPATLSSANVVVPETDAVITTGGQLTISDVDSPALFQAQAGTAGTFGSFSIDAAGVWSYTTYNALNNLPAGMVASDSFTVLAADGTPTTVTVTVDGTDDPAIAFTDVFTTDEASIVTGSVFFGNSINADFDPDGLLSVASINGSAANVGRQIQLASGALLRVNADGTMSYDPNGAFDTLTSPFTGASNTAAFDSFHYALDGGGVAIVLVQVNGLRSAGDRLEGNGFSNRLTGNDLDDMFFLQQGGNDQAFGGAGSDGFYFGSAFTPADTVDGGIGIDSLALQGNYAGLSLGSVSAVELLVLLSGSDRRFGDTAGNLYDYQVATTDGNVPAGGIFTVQAETLLAGEDLKFDGSAETDGHFRIFAGQGNDDLTGGAGNDGFLFGNGGNLDGNDRIHGGPGTDSVALRGNYVGADAVVFDNASLDSVEVLVFLSGLTREFGGTIFPAGFDYDVTMADGNVAAGQVMSVIAALLSANESVRFDGRAETDGAFRILSGAGDDVLLGSQQADTLYGGLGADQMDGQAGADVYVYRSTSESTAAAADRLTMDAADLIDLRTIDANVGAAGDQAFAFIGSGAFTGTAGQLRATFSGGLWTIEGDTNGDGVADLFIQATSPDPITGSEFLF